MRSDAVFDQAGLEWLLELGNSSITYRSRYLAVAQLIPVLDLLLLDEQNPHAVLFPVKAGGPHAQTPERRFWRTEGNGLARVGDASFSL
nr:hypothetical protein GCM10020185_24080 [Pseudomonas brassicacearum subsp. brassicacearum]